MDLEKQHDTHAEKQGGVPPCPATYLVWAVLTTVLCCLPFGVVSIVYATQVSTLHAQGLYAQAENASRKARLWAIVSAAAAFATVIPYLILLICLAVTVDA